jgi:hypothetical protein
MTASNVRIITTQRISAIFPMDSIRRQSSTMMTTTASSPTA